MTKRISIKQAASLLVSLYEIRYPFFFHVNFIKRETGELRSINCRIAVEKYLKGGKLAYDPLSKNLIVVCDKDLIERFKKGEVRSPYRSINLDAIVDMTIGKVHYVVEKEVANV